jgi:uncharacterized protein (TIGR02996 family)
MTATRTAHDAFLEAICAAPEDDTPRLVYADWLEEHGEGERAEFIRLQCRISALEARCGCGRCVRLRGGGQHHNGPCAVDQERVTLPDGRSKQAFLRRRERELLAEDGPPIHGSKTRLHKDGTSETLAYRWLPVPVLHCEWWEFRRGFIESISLPCADWIQHAADIIEAVPTVREVRLTDRDPDPDGSRPRNHGWLNIDYMKREYWQEWNDYPAHLPESLWAHLPKGVSDNAAWKFYPTAEIAHAALSTACLAFAREQLRERQKRQEQERLIVFGNPQAPAPQGIINRPRKKR